MKLGSTRPVAGADACPLGRGDVQEARGREGMTLTSRPIRPAYLMAFPRSRSSYSPNLEAKASWLMMMKSDLELHALTNSGNTLWISSMSLRSRSIDSSVMLLR